MINVGSESHYTLFCYPNAPSWYMDAPPKLFGHPPREYLLIFITILLGVAVAPLPSIIINLAVAVKRRLLFRARSHYPTLPTGLPNPYPNLLGEHHLNPKLCHQAVHGIAIYPQQYWWCLRISVFLISMPWTSSRMPRFRISTRPRRIIM